MTFCTFQRWPLFTDALLVHILRTQILRAARERAFEIPAYCFMPEHLHLLVTGSDDEALLPGFVKYARQLTGFYGRRHAGKRIWQQGFFDRVLDEDEDPRAVIAYILMNPVRAGLVSSPEQYPFSGSGLCELSELVEQVRRYL